MRRRLTSAIFILAMIQAGAAQDHSQHRAPSIPREFLERPLPLRNGIGAAHDPVSTTNDQAQAYYDQGLAYMHSYVWLEAARSFNQALRIDPKLGIAHSALSIVYVELNSPDMAHAAMENAQKLAPASGHDRRHVELRRLQMAAEDAPKDKAVLAAYRTALDKALVEFPNDEELWLLRGMAESADPADRGQGSVASSVTFYERAAKLGGTHFAADHYLVHALENTGKINEALNHGLKYAIAAPNVAHAHHMLAHDLRRVGKIDEAVEEFETADVLASKYFEAERVPKEFDWHYQHNLDLLGSAYQYIGQMAKAERMLSLSFGLASASAVQEFNKREWPAFLIARGRTDEAIAAADVMMGHPSPLIRSTGHAAKGRALAAAGKFAQAAEEANAALRELRTAGDGSALPARAVQELQAEFYLFTGQPERGQALLDDTLVKLRTVVGPDEWSQALFSLESLARAARAAGKWPAAERIARLMVEHDPAYAGSHYSLGLALEHNGDAAGARAQFELARKFWAKADSDLPELKETQKRLQ